MQAPPGLQGAVDVTVVAQAAVAAASTELGAALAKAKSANLTLARTQQEDPEVGHCCPGPVTSVQMDFGHESSSVM